MIYLIRGSYPVYIKNSYNLRTKNRANNPLKNGQRNWIDISPKMIYKWPVHLTLFNHIFKNGQDGKFYVTSILQSKKTANHINRWPAMNTHKQGKIYKPHHDHFFPGLEICTNLTLSTLCINVPCSQHVSDNKKCLQMLLNVGQW